MMKYTKGVMNFLFPGRSGLWCEVAFAMEAWKHCVTLTMKTTRQTQGRMHTREERTPNPTDRQTTDKGRAGGTPKAREPPPHDGGRLARVPASKDDGSRRSSTPRSLSGRGVQREREEHRDAEHRGCGKAHRRRTGAACASSEMISRDTRTNQFEFVSRMPWTAWYG